MKKEAAYVLLMIISGIFVALAITAILMAFPSPAHFNSPLTITEKQDFELMSKVGGWVSRNLIFIIYIPTILLFFITTIFYLLILNPNIKAILFRRKNIFKIKKDTLKLTLIFLISISIPFLFAFLESILGLSIHRPFFPKADMNGSETYNIFVFIEAFLAGGLFWLVIGEMGWGGDFSSWKMGTKGKKPEPLKCFILGGTVGLVSAGILFLYDLVFNKYFVLVSEVLDKSGETSFLGFKLLAYGLMTMTGISFAIIAGLTVAMSPTYRDRQYRLKRLIFPVVLIVIMASTVFGTSQYASARYDLDKNDLAEAVGIPDKSSISKTILLFKQDENGSEIILQEWHLEIEGYGMMAGGTIELSYENLEKLHDYLNEHKSGSIFNYAAEDALYKGYHALWDMRKGLERQFIASHHFLLPRLMIIKRMQYFPITAKNLEYLKAYTEETKWHMGGRYAIEIAKGFIHFGLYEEAKKWLKKATESGADPSEVAEVQIPTKILTNGKIYGSVTVNGKPPSNTKAAIFINKGIHDEIEILDLTVDLVDAQNLGSKGKFMFKNLGQETYTLALMTDREIIPYDISPEKIKVRNVPGLIELRKKASEVNVGNIDIVIR